MCLGLRLNAPFFSLFIVYLAPVLGAPPLAVEVTFSVINYEKQITQFSLSYIVITHICIKNMTVPQINFKLNTNVQYLIHFSQPMSAVTISSYQHSPLNISRINFTLCCTHTLYSKIRGLTKLSPLLAAPSIKIMYSM